MIENCHIRAFETSDLPQLHKVREVAFLPVFQSFRTMVGVKVASVAFVNAEREQMEHLDRICRAGSSSHEVFVVVSGEEVIAFCSFTLDANTKVGEIDLNAVHPDFQGKGIGSWMYSYVLDQMKHAGMRVATVGTGGDASHEPARKAYEKAGFGTPIPTLYLYKSLSNSDNILLH